MQSRIREFRHLGAEVVVVSFVPPSPLKQYLSGHEWEFPVLADPDRRAYRAFGLERASWARLLRPRVLGRYLRLMLRGRMPRLAHEDVHQLGGDFVLDRDARVVFAHRSTDPADRPAVAELLEAVRRIAAPVQ